ncbi:unnamed protein product, partial [Iphiclides podalirius]
MLITGSGSVARHDTRAASPAPARAAAARRNADRRNAWPEATQRVKRRNVGRLASRRGSTHPQYKLGAT